MLTIKQLATYAGVTVRAVRHYHQIGLLAEPGRNASGYRTYDAGAVVRLIRIRTLADAGVPLARVQELLDATPDDFAQGIREIDDDLRREVERLQESRTRIAGLLAGDALALPRSVVEYLDRLRRMGFDERYLELERDAWIMVAAQVPDQIDGWIAKKHEELDDPDMARLYALLSTGLDWPEDDPRVVEVADILDRLLQNAFDAGETGAEGLDDPLVDLLDEGVQAWPAGRRLLALLAERGWRGWTRIERLDTPTRPPAASSSRSATGVA